MRPRRFGRHRRPYPEPIGLNHLLQVDSLLAVIPGVKVALTDCAVTGGADGWTVAATQTDTAVAQDYGAGGFAAYCNSAELSGCHVSGLVSVTASEDQGFAGGFVGISRTGGLADLANEDGNLQVGGSLISVNDLLGTVDIMVPNYTDCTVTYLDGGFVQADVAGGFAGELQSGKVNNQSRGEGDYFAVYNIDHVTGRTYAGGFGGIVRSGALADAGGGISILGGSGLTINLSELLNLVEAYVPFIQYAGVKAEQGFTVTAATLDPLDSASGSAGGFLGYASGAQISTCDVTNLKHTAVTAPSDLEAVEAPSYFDPVQSSYAVTGGRYAGGFVGCMDIGSAASVGDGLGVLESSIQLTNILDALSVVVTTIEHSDVSGGPGGYSILANANDSTGALGLAGGYAGAVYGGHIQDSNAHNFAYIVGQIAAGGYAGQMEPGDVADLLGDASILGSLVSADAALASLLQTFVPTIRNSSTDCVPCGGAVRAQAASDATVQRGMAGGYVGHNMGGSIWGLNTDPWKTATEPYPGPTSVCKADRIRSVYGAEYAGGYTGFMEAADTASVGGLNVLNGLISVGNILGALSVVYPTQENTAVYGPLANLDYQTWNAWVEYVGQYGGYGYELAQTGAVSSQAELDAKLAGYIYGFHVVAGRSQKDVTLTNQGGDAGGYVGLMRSGALTNCMAYDVKLVRALRAAGGFAGGLLGGTIRNSSVNGLSTVQGLNYTGGFMGHMGKSGVVDIDSLEALGKLLGATVGAIDLFGSQLYDNTMSGISAGAVVKAKDGQQPIAGGFVGYGDLGRIDNSSASNLKKVESDQVAGGFIGQTDMNYIVSAQVQSILLEAVLQIVNQLLEALYIGDLENLGLIDLDLWVLSIELLSDGNTLKVELLGLPITVALSKQADNPDQQTDVAIITIGDSEIRLPCSEQEGVQREDLENVEINLIKGNRTELEGCSVTGISNGYDVFGGGAGQDADGSGDLGIAGGFVGYNHEGKVTDSQTLQCDTVRGAAGKVGPFSGYNDLRSVYAFNTVQNIEGQNNTYSIYRSLEETLTGAALEDGTTLATALAEGGWNRYVVTHLAAYSGFADLENAVETGEGVQRELLVYISPAKAVLMRDANAPDNPPLTVPEPGEGADPCAQLVDWTIQKIWKDWNDWDKLRPETVTITIYQQKFSADGTAQGKRPPMGSLSPSQRPTWNPAVAPPGARWWRICPWPSTSRTRKATLPIPCFLTTFTPLRKPRYRRATRWRSPRISRRLPSPSSTATLPPCPTPAAGETPCLRRWASGSFCWQWRRPWRAGKRRRRQGNPISSQTSKAH